MKPHFTPLVEIGLICLTITLSANAYFIKRLVDQLDTACDKVSRLEEKSIRIEDTMEVIKQRLNMRSENGYPKNPNGA